jgi:DnaJ-class molecular chaperone
MARVGPRSIALLLRRAHACAEPVAAARPPLSIGGDGDSDRARRSSGAPLATAAAAAASAQHQHQQQQQQPPLDRGRRDTPPPQAAAAAWSWRERRAPRYHHHEQRRGIASSSSASAPPPPPPPPPSGRDYYEVLGVARSASDQDIKRAYYRLAKKYHPDTNAGDAAAAASFQEVQKAYEALRDPERRRLYDAVGRERMERMDAEGGGGAGGGPGGGPFGAAGGPFGGPFGGGGGAGPFSAADVFEHLFGGGAAGAGADPIFGAFFGGGAGAAVVEAPLRLTFAEAARGTKKWVDVGPGLGVAAGGGAGGGPGPVEVSIPAGVDDGQAVEVTVPLGPAPPPPPGARGRPPPPPRLRLRLRVQVEPDPVFRREGAHLHVDATLRLAEALLGRAMKVPTLDGGAEVFVPPGTMHGDVLRLRGKGLPDPRRGGGGLGGGAKGDQYVHVRVPKPVGGLTDRQRELLMQFDAEERAKGQQKKQGGGGRRDEEEKAAAA